VTSTLGSSTALGGYVAMTVALTTAMIVARSARPDSEKAVIPIDVWRALAMALLGLQVVVVLLTSVRAALVGGVVGLVAMFLILELTEGRLGRRLVVTLALAGLVSAMGVVGLSVFRGASADIDGATLPRADTSLSERLDLWRSAQRYLVDTLTSRPVALLTGAGPDQQAVLLERWLEPALPTRLPTTLFDRAHLSPVDVLLTTGVLGLLSVTALLSIALGEGVRASIRADSRGRAVFAGVCGSIVGFIAESSVSFPSITTLTLIAILIGATAGSTMTTSVNHANASRFGKGQWGWTAICGLVALVLMTALPGLGEELRADRAFQRSLAYAANEELSTGIDLAEEAQRLAPHRDIYAAHLTELLLQRAQSAPRDESSRPKVLDEQPGVQHLLERAALVSDRPRSTNPFMFTLHAHALDEVLDARGVEHGSRDAAVQSAIHAATLAPWRVDLKDAAARLALHNADAELALHLYAEASALDPVQSQRIAETGHAYRMLGNDREARRLYDEALRRDDQSAEAWWGLARLSMERAEWSEALEPAMQAARYQMREWRFHRDLGYVYYELGDRAAARQELRTALRLCPSWHWETLRAQVDGLQGD
jgi:tetratricopeptide (TPR) repeat protein